MIYSYLFPNKAEDCVHTGYGDTVTDWTRVRSVKQPIGERVRDHVRMRVAGDRRGLTRGSMGFYSSSPMNEGLTKCGIEPYENWVILD